MNKSSILLIFFLFVQDFYLGAQILPINPASGHYLELQLLNAEPNGTALPLDSIQFPSNSRNTGLNYIGIEPNYLSRSNVLELTKLLDFPANSSEQTKAELEYLVRLQNERTDRDINRAIQIARIGYWPSTTGSSYLVNSNIEDLLWLCKSAVEHCNENTKPKTTSLLAAIMKDTRTIEFTIKYAKLRPRPYQLESELEPLGTIPNPSFPSGHTLWAYIQAYTLSELSPEHRKQFIALAREVGISREILGLHYPSDEEAARRIAHRMLELMIQDQHFLSDLEQAKSEWEN